ncbi:hypothetical protein AGMMS49960_21700 [Betaproteobacteria bacterium]|nr:hypothetical protein AGMMS49960_21700 [Betaproteobacteria bacterium]
MVNLYISFPPNSRTKEMITFLMEVRQLNSENSYLWNPYIQNTLSYEDLKITEIIEELEQEPSENSLLKQEPSEDSSLKTMILNHVYPDKSEKQIIKDLKKYAEKEKMSKKHETANKKKLEEILGKLYVASLMLLESFFSENKPLVIVLDNYPVHRAKLLKEACIYMNIILVHLPPYSPKLNPIEQVWRTIKKELSAEFIESEEFLVSNFERLFYENVDKKSFTKNWVDDFIFDRSKDLLIADMCECAVLAA